MEWWWDLLKAMDAHEGQAAWAQAFATAVALSLALQQGYSSNRRERGRDRAAATAAYVLVNNASQVVVHFHADLVARKGAAQKEVARRVIESGRLAETEAALAAFDTTRLPEDVFATAVGGALTSVREFRQAVENIVHPSELLIRDLGRPVERIQDAANMMVTPLVKLSPGFKWREFRTRVARQRVVSPGPGRGE